MSYTLKKSTTSVYKEKQSEFVGHIFPIKTIQNFKTQLKQLKKDYHDARHFCWAYRMQSENGVEENASDGGEPSGTAGLPILNQLKQNQLINTGLIVIRYFGGTKLGKRGLIDAYGITADETIQKGSPIPFQNHIQYRLNAPTEFFGALSNHIQKCRCRIIEDHSIDSINWIIESPRENINQLIIVVREITHGQGYLEPWDEKKEQANPNQGGNQGG